MANSEELQRLIDEYAMLLAEANHSVAKERARLKGLQETVQDFKRSENIRANSPTRESKDDLPPPTPTPPTYQYNEWDAEHLKER